MGKGLNNLDDDDYIDVVEEESFTQQLIFEQYELDEEKRTEQYYKYGASISATDLIEIYEKTNTNDEKEPIYIMINGFNPELKMSEFEDKIYSMYTNVILQFITDECPTHIFNTDFTATYYPEFYKFVMKSTIMGRNLTKLVDIITNHRIVS